MISIRRKLGAFAVAVTIAAGMVLMPASIHAKAKTSGSLDSFCAQVASAIEYANGLSDGTIKDLLLAQLNAIDAAYCN